MAALAPIPTPSGEPPAAFRPDEAQVAALIDALCSPSLSVQQVATQFGTSIDALCLYIVSPRGSESLATLDSALSIRLRLVALSALPAAAASLSAIVQDHAAQEKALAASRSPGLPTAPLDDAKFEELKLLERRRVNARKASSLLFRLATLHPRVDRCPPSRPTPGRDSSATQAQRAASASKPTPSPATGPSRSPSGASSTIEPLDPLDRIDALSAFALPRGLRAQTPRAESDISCALHGHSGLGADDLTLSRSPCGMLKRPLEHGSANSNDAVPSPALRELGATGAASLIARAGSIAPVNNATLNVPAHPVSSREPCASPSKATVRPARAASQVDASSAPHGPAGCTPGAGGEAAPRGAHPRKAGPNHRTLKGSAMQAHPPTSLASGP